MKIRLTVDVPVGKQEGMTKGRVMEVIGTPERTGLKKRMSANAVLVRGNVGEVTLWPYEYEVVGDDGD